MLALPLKILQERRKLLHSRPWKATLISSDFSSLPIPALIGLEQYLHTSYHPFLSLRRLCSHYRDGPYLLHHQLPSLLPLSIIVQMGNMEFARIVFSYGTRKASKRQSQPRLDS